MLYYPRSSNLELNWSPNNRYQKMLTEEQMQSECAIWFWNSFPDYRRMLFHVDNNSQNSIVGARKKALGVCKGPSDFILVLREGRVVFIELKTEIGSQSTEQKDFESKVVERGHEYIVIRSVDKFKNFVTRKLINDEPN